MAARRVRQAEYRAHRALIRAGFTDPATASVVLRQVQVLTMTAVLARLDYHTPHAAQAAIANLIVSPPAATPRPGTGYPPPRTAPPKGTRYRSPRHRARSTAIRRTAFTMPTTTTPS
jgi:hypothetical protein